MITREAWDAALREAMGDPTANNDPDALTTAELAKLWGIEHGHARLRVKQMVSAGVATKTSKRIVLSTGRVVPAPAYKLAVKPKKRGSR